MHYMGPTGAVLVHHPSLAFGELRLGKPSEFLTREGCRAGAWRRHAEAGLIPMLNELRLGKPCRHRGASVDSTTRRVSAEGSRSPVW